MIFQRSLLREFTIAAAGVFTVLLAITLTTQLIRFLGQAAKGSISTEAVLAMLGFSSLNYLPVLLSITVYLAVLMSLTRSYRDSEMPVWFSAGLSLTAWIKPVLWFVMPLVFTIALLSLFLSPWAVQRSEIYKQKFESQDDVSNIAPGVFKESKHAERVYFIESFGGGGQVKNIFVQSVQHGQLGTMVAKSGYQTTMPNGDQFLVLLNGKRYEGQIGSLDYKILDFENYAMRIEPFEATQPVLTFKSMPTLTLLQQPIPPHLGELAWRVGLPISALILALMAIPLSFVNPRSGRSANILLALFIYMVYNNLLSLAQAWIAQSKISPVLGFTLMHGLMLGLLLLLFYRRLSVAVLWRRAERI